MVAYHTIKGHSGLTIEINYCQTWYTAYKKFYCVGLIDNGTEQEYRRWGWNYAFYKNRYMKL